MHFDQCIVSPFTRTLQTFSIIMRDREPIETVINPLCAEHSLIFSKIAKGDRGTKQEELQLKFQADTYPY